MFRNVKSTVIALTIAALSVGGNSLSCYAQEEEQSTTGQSLGSPGAVEPEEGQPEEGQPEEGQGREGQGSRESDEGSEAMESEDFQRENSQQDKPGQAETNAKGAKVKISKDLPVLRLPRYFAGLVDQSQRSQIQRIQLQFRSRIDQLEEELRNLKQEELDALEQVLTASQRKLLDTKRQQSKASRVAVNLSEHEDPSAAR